MQPMNRFYRICLSIICVLLIIYLFLQIQSIFVPFIKAFNIIMLPILVAIFFYYLLRPIIGYLHRWKIPKGWGILIIYAVAAGLFTLFLLLVWPTLREQIVGFVNNLPQLASDLQKQFNLLQQNRFFQDINQNISQSEINSKLATSLSQLLTRATDSIANAVKVVSNLVIIVSTVPIILYYLLKEDTAAHHKLIDRLPKRYRKDAQEMMTEMDKVLSEFILGRVILCLLLGLMVYIGFLIIGLPYSLLLGLFIAAMNMIPYIGQLLGLIPCMIVAFIDSPSMAIWVLAIVLLAQQIENNLLSPHIYGRKLDIHPLTTILLLLVSGTIGGIIGILVAIPFYLILKIIALRLYDHYRPAELD